MASSEKKPVALEELLISSLAQTDALAKLLIKKGIITQEEFLQKIAEERTQPYSIHQHTDFWLARLVSLVVVENRFFGIGVQIFLPQLPYNERSLNSQRLSIPPLRVFQR